MRAFLLVCLVALSALPLAAHAEQVQVHLTDLECEYTDWQVDQPFSIDFAEGYLSVTLTSVRYKGYFQPCSTEWTDTTTGNVIEISYPSYINTDLGFWGGGMSTPLPTGDFDLLIPAGNSDGFLTPFTATGLFGVRTMIAPPDNYESTGTTPPTLRLDEVYMTFEATPVPEPSGLLTLLCGIGGLAGVLRHRRG